MAGTDYVAASGTLTIPRGSSSATIPVTINAVGYEADKTFTIDLTNSHEADIATGHAVGTIHGRSPVAVTIATRPAKVDIQQTAAGPTPVDVQVDVTVTNQGTGTLDDVTLPNKLTLGWHGPAPLPTIPLQQTAAPSPLNIGPLAPGETSQPSTYTVRVTGDGNFDVDALVLAGDHSSGASLRGFGRLNFKPDSQLLVFRAKLGAKVRSRGPLR